MTDDGALEAPAWVGMFTAFAAIGVLGYVWRSRQGVGSVKSPQDLERARKAAVAARVVKEGPWELLEKALSYEKFSMLRIDSIGLHAFWIVRPEGDESFVRRRVLRGCLEGRMEDEPLTGKGVSTFAPFDGGVALFDGDGAACMTIPENEAIEATFVRVHSPQSRGEVVCAPDVDLTRSERSHCGGYMNAALVAPRGGDLVAVNLTKGTEQVILQGSVPITALALDETASRLAFYTRAGELKVASLGPDRVCTCVETLWTAEAPFVGRPTFHGDSLFVATDRAVRRFKTWNEPANDSQYDPPAGATIAAFCLGPTGLVFAASDGNAVHPLPQPAPATVRELAVSREGDLYAIADHGCLFKYAQASDPKPPNPDA